MQYGICTLSIVPCRREPSGASEMVTQLLFGEHYTVLEIREDWLRIITAFDKYECWISEKQHTRVSEGTFKKLQTEQAALCSEMVHPVNSGQGQSFPVTIGAVFPFLKNGKMELEHQHFTFDGHTVESRDKKDARAILGTAFLFLHAPYLWGGRSPFGIDCSGFTQITYRLNGYELPRDAYQQVELGTPLTFADEAEAGDLAFFDNEEGRITHVGILLNNHEIIHASGKVKIDRFDHYGIFGSEKKKYTHHLRVIKRLL